MLNLIQKLFIYSTVLLFKFEYNYLDHYASAYTK